MTLSAIGRKNIFARCFTGVEGAGENTCKVAGGEMSQHIHLYLADRRNVS